MNFSPKQFLRRKQVVRESELKASMRRAVLATTKRVEIEVMSRDNKRVIQRFRFVPPGDAKARFTAAGIDYVLENFVDSFERDNPGHKYRLVVCSDKYKLVWTEEEELDADANVCAEAAA